MGVLNMKDYIYESLENDKYVYYLYQSSHRKNTTNHWIDWYNQVGRNFKATNPFREDRVYIDNAKNRYEQEIKTVIDCRK